MVLPPVSEKKFTADWPKLKICVTGAGGFIASHLSKRLKEEGHFVRAVDWKENEYMKTEDFCDEFVNLDLRWPENCKKAVEGCDWCFNLAVRPASSHLPRAQSLRAKAILRDIRGLWSRLGRGPSGQAVWSQAFALHTPLRSGETNAPACAAGC